MVNERRERGRGKETLRKRVSSLDLHFNSNCRGTVPLNPNLDFLKGQKGMGGEGERKRERGRKGGIH